MNAMWKCATCGVEHSELPLCYGAEARWHQLVPEAEFSSRVELNEDLCVVDERVFFIRGHIELPIVGESESFCWSVWCSLSEESFRHCNTQWHSDEREGDRYFGWLSTKLPCYPESSLNLKTNVCSRRVGQVPLIEVQECGHPLYREQSDGITRERIQVIAHELLCVS